MAFVGLARYMDRIILLIVLGLGLASTKPAASHLD